jgi:hypothetical protein
LDQFFGFVDVEKDIFPLQQADFVRHPQPGERGRRIIAADDDHGNTIREKTCSPGNDSMEIRLGIHEPIVVQDNTERWLQTTVKGFEIAQDES